MDTGVTIRWDLVDQSIQGMLREKPLIIFSFYLQMNIESLCRTETRILSAIDDFKDIDGTLHIEMPSFQIATDLFWLWTLGAYEVIRVMWQEKECFQPSLHNKLKTLRHTLSELRMPFAKLELAHNGPLVTKELSIFSVNKSDGLMYRVRDTVYSSAEVMKDFRLFMLGIGTDGIVKPGRWEDKWLSIFKEA